MAGDAKAFFSYSRQDSEFALRLAKDLRQRGAAIWIDQLDIEPGTHWDQSVEKAVAQCSIMLVVLSPNSTQSENVMDEVAYAIDEKKVIIPVMFADCKLPLRLRRTQYIDLRASYENGLKEILKTLHVVRETGTMPVPPPIPKPSQQAADEVARAQQQAQAAQAERERQAQIERERQAQIERDRQIAAARQQSPPPYSAIQAAAPPKKRRVLWIVAGAIGGLFVLGIIISAINNAGHPSGNIAAPTASMQRTTPPDTRSPTGQGTADAADQQALLSWLNGLIQASQGPSVDNLLPYYSGTVSPYFSMPIAQWPQIAADKQAYFTRFPQVRYQLVSWQHRPRQDGSEEIYGSLRYTAVRQDGVVAHGISNLWMIVRQESGQWKIIAIQERTQP